jgi:hypothetical protein
MVEDSESAQDVEDDAREAQKFLEHDRNALAKQIDTECSIQCVDVAGFEDGADAAASAAAAIVVVVVVDDTSFFNSLSNKAAQFVLFSSIKL